MPLAALAPMGRGFSDPVFEAQRSFRAVLSAMAEPGTIHRFETSADTPPGFEPATAALLLTLADHATPAWLAPDIGAEAKRYVGFHCGAPAAASPGESSLAVLDGRTDVVPLALFNAGAERYPDRSATVIVQCAGLTGGGTVDLSGPGIRGARSIAPRGLRAGFWREVAANHARYPLGIDLILTAGCEMLALPRSTQVAILEERP